MTAQAIVNRLLEATNLASYFEQPFGNRLAAAAKLVDPETRTCAECGEVVPEGELCPACKSRYPHYVYHSARQSSAEPSESPTANPPFPGPKPEKLSPKEVRKLTVKYGMQPLKWKNRKPYTRKESAQQVVSALLDSEFDPDDPAGMLPYLKAADACPYCGSSDFVYDSGFVDPTGFEVVNYFCNQCRRWSTNEKGSTLVKEAVRRNRYNPMGLHRDRHGRLLDKYGREMNVDWEKFDKKRLNVGDELKSPKVLNPLHQSVVPKKV